MARDVARRTSCGSTPSASPLITANIIMYHSAPAAPTGLRPDGPPRPPAPPTTSPFPASTAIATSALPPSSSTPNAYLPRHAELLRIRGRQDARGARAEDDGLHRGEALDRTRPPTQHVAKPRSKNNYCSVCKSSYEDYLEVCGGLCSTSTPSSTPDASATRPSRGISRSLLDGSSGSTEEKGPLPLLVTATSQLTTRRSWTRTPPLAIRTRMRWRSSPTPIR